MALTPVPRLSRWHDVLVGMIGDVWSQWMNALRAAVNLTPGNSLPVLVADLPQPVTGMMIVVTDSTTNTWGAIVTGGGLLTVAAFYNGSNWTVIGK
jgi:hypothetical protein